mmetsp:Transcript_88217/g.189316  ORF Transcript_88217/g.189316 Transcript_88217/m.189316 type:complete len:183 (+) Transcript_88217:101-649(+)
MSAGPEPCAQSQSQVVVVSSYPGARALPPAAAGVACDGGKNPWSKWAFRSTYRTQHSLPAAVDFNTRHLDANMVVNQLYGSPAITPRKPPSRSLITASSYTNHFPPKGTLQLGASASEQAKEEEMDTEAFAAEAAAAAAAARCTASPPPPPRKILEEAEALGSCGGDSADADAIAKMHYALA